MVNRIVGNRNVDLLVELIINDWDMISKIQFEKWKELSFAISELTNIVENELNEWKGEEKFIVPGGRILFSLRKEIEQFQKKCEEREEFNSGWKGSVEDCIEVFDNFRKNVIPLFIQIAGHLDIQHPFRAEIEEKMREHNYPMLW